MPSRSAWPRPSRMHKRNALAHAAGELAALLKFEMLEADKRDQLARPLITGVLVHAEHLRSERDVVDHVAPRKQIEILPHHHRPLAGPR